jgi:hypothetical protein
VAGDFDVLDRTGGAERDVGRIFLQADGQWFWGVSFQLTGRKSYGHAPTLDWGQGRIPGRVREGKYKSGNSPYAKTGKFRPAFRHACRRSLTRGHNRQTRV